MPWYVVETAPMRERAACAAIASVVEPFCPMQRVLTKRGPLLYPLLPRHLFVLHPGSIDPDTWHAICAHDAVRGILGGEQPRPVMPERSFRIRMADGTLGDMLVGADRIEEWRAQADADGVVLGLEPLLDEWRVGHAVGDVVAIDYGLYRGYTGIVAAIDRENRTTTVKIACNWGPYPLKAPSSDCTLVGKGRDAAERMSGGRGFDGAALSRAHSLSRRSRRGGKGRRQREGLSL